LRGEKCKYWTVRPDVCVLELFPTNLDNLMKISGSLGQAGHQARCDASCKLRNALDGLDIITRFGPN